MRERKKRELNERENVDTMGTNKGNDVIDDDYSVPLVYPTCTQAYPDNNETDISKELDDIAKCTLEREDHFKTPVIISKDERKALEDTYRQMVEGKMVINGFALAMMARNRDADIPPHKCSLWLDQTYKRPEG
jgi:hypothetical protein